MTRAKPTPENDLDLHAQAYVFGELDAAESAAFEALLATDQDAREAVARAVALCAALDPLTETGVSEPATAQAPILPFVQRRGVRWAAAAALVALAVWGARALQSDGGPDPAPEDLIASWIEFGADSPLENGSGEAGDPDDEQAEDLDATQSAPDWLVLALREEGR